MVPLGSKITYNDKSTRKPKKHNISITAFCKKHKLSTLKNAHLNIKKKLIKTYVLKCSNK